MKENRIFIGVAVRHRDLVVALPKPNRHHHVLRYMVETLGIKPPVGNSSERGQGFYTEKGEYVDRFDARSIAIESGQCLKPQRTYALFSEDLW